MSKQHICYSVRNVKKMKCQHNLVPAPKKRKIRVAMTRIFFVKLAL